MDFLVLLYEDLSSNMTVNFLPPLRGAADKTPQNLPPRLDFSAAIYYDKVSMCPETREKRGDTS